MTTQEKRPLVFMTIDIITFSIYTIMLLKFSPEHIRTFEEIPFWSTSILILIPTMILFRVTFYIIYSVFNTMLTKEREMKFLMDEFGELIRLKATRNFSTTFTIGFVATMVLLAIGASISIMFKMFFLSIFIAFIIQNISEFYYAKKGI